MLGNISSPKQLSHIETVRPGKWQSVSTWSYLKYMWMWYSGTWFSSGLGSDWLSVGLSGLSHLKVFFQINLFHDSLIL